MGGLITRHRRLPAHCCGGSGGSVGRRSWCVARSCPRAAGSRRLSPFAWASPCVIRILRRALVIPGVKGPGHGELSALPRRVAATRLSCRLLFVTAGLACGSKMRFGAVGGALGAGACRRGGEHLPAVGRPPAPLWIDCVPGVFVDGSEINPEMWWSPSGRHNSPHRPGYPMWMAHRVLPAAANGWVPSASGSYRETIPNDDGRAWFGARRKDG